MPFDVQRIQQDGAAAAAPGLDHFPDTLRFLQLLDELAAPAAAVAEADDRTAARELFDWQEDVVVARAPGRLDVMGGIADYSGSLVLQMPLAEACHVAVQRHPAVPGPAQLRIVSFHHGTAFEMGLEQLLPGGEPISYDAARALFKRDPSHSWTAYVAGALVVLMREQGARFDRGLSILVSSDVPEGKGVSSSASLEVATMSALTAAHGMRLDGRSLALLCQKVENSVVGAPCGVMDQMTAALGEEARLLALRCQPAEVQGSAPIPAHMQFWGVDSGIVHSVGGSDYGHVRAGTFMGLRIISQMAHDSSSSSNGPHVGLKSSSGSSSMGFGAHVSSGTGPPAGPECSGGSGPWAGKHSGSSEAPPIGGGYLANLPPSEFGWRYEQRLPEAVQGGAFLQQYGSHWDYATSIDPEQSYSVRTPAGHPVHENFRVQAFRQVLAAPPGGSEQLEVLGELMRQSHVSYGRCGLGSDGTDRLVGLAQDERDAAVARGEEPALYGAKITGGGCGGTVCILGVAGPPGEAAFQRVVQRYSEERQYTPQVFRGSSSGSAAFGHLVLRRCGA